MGAGRKIPIGDEPVVPVVEGRHVLGIDIGGTGIKGAVVDVDVGALAAERFRVLTPQPATPKAVSAKVGEIVEHFAWEGPIGCGSGCEARPG